MHWLHITKHSFLRVKKIKTIDRFIQTFFKVHSEKLALNYPGINEHRLIGVFCEYFQKTPNEVMALDELDPFFARLLDGEPLEYILGEKFFFNSRFFVNSNVLIPRNETEILVERAVDLIAKNKWSSFADIGTGTGCIALSILCESKSNLDAFAVDIDDKALEVCSINHFRHLSKIPSGSKFTMLKGDRCTPLKTKVDFIVTNPPYIDFETGREGVHFQTDKREPAIALYLGSEEYDSWFSKLFEDSWNLINSGGAFLMEGHEDKLEIQKTMALKKFDRAQIIKDYTGADRFLLAYKD